MTRSPTDLKPVRTDALIPANLAMEDLVRAFDAAGGLAAPVGDGSGLPESSPRRGGF